MTTMMARLLFADRVTVTYGGTRPVLHEVSAVAEPGRVLAVTGGPGAGKTTLLRALAGLIRPAGGVVTVEGAPLRDRDHAVARRIVLIPQDNGLASILTAAENITVALLADGAAPADARRGTAEALARLGLTGQADQLVEELSAEQQQRTAVARGLALRGDVVLADEVTSDLDARNRRQVLDLLHAEAVRGAAVVLATRDSEAVAGCDAELRLIDGRGEMIRLG
jgi:putative ABC transport system ATP-binding protein